MFDFKFGFLYIFVYMCIRFLYMCKYLFLKVDVKVCFFDLDVLAVDISGVI